MWTLTAFRLGYWLTGLAPERVGYAAASLAGFLAYQLFWRAHAGVDRNLQRVLPAATAAQRRRIGIRIFQNSARNYYDLVRLPRLSLQHILDLVDIDGWEKVEAALATKRGVIMVSAHLGNLELVGQVIAARGVPILVLAQPLEPPALFNYVAGLRASKGLTIMPVGPAALRQVIRTLRAGQMIGIVGDRDIQGRGQPAPFFGEPASLPVGFLELAMRQKAILLPAFIHRTGRRYRGEVLDPLELADTGNRAADLRTNLLRWAALLEARISAHPDEWVVFEDFWRPRGQPNDGASSLNQPALGGSASGGAE